MSRQLTLTLRNDLAELERVADAVDAFGKSHNLPATALFDLHLALDEVLTNVVSYGYDDDGEHEIVVRLGMPVRHGSQLIEVEVEDDGRPFNPLDAPPPDVHASVEQRRIGGLGIYLVRRVMDDLEYRRQQDRNVLVMRKTVAA
jgi:serine/threonine-protein kinase RsbW